MTMFKTPLKKKSASADTRFSEWNEVGHNNFLTSFMVTMIKNIKIKQSGKNHGTLYTD